MEGSERGLPGWSKSKSTTYWRMNNSGTDYMCSFGLCAGYVTPLPYYAHTIRTWRTVDKKKMVVAFFNYHIPYIVYTQFLQE